MTIFDKFVCNYSEVHTSNEVINMLQCHKEYIHFSKYNHSVNRIKQDENKIAHINAIINFLKLVDMPNSIINLRECYFND